MKSQPYSRVVIVGSSGPISLMLQERLRLCGVKTLCLGRSPQFSDVLISDEYETPNSEIGPADFVIFLAWPTSRRDLRSQLGFVETTEKWARFTKRVSATFLFISTTQAFSDSQSNYGRAKFAAERRVLENSGYVLRVGLIVDDSLDCLATRIRTSNLTRFLPRSIQILPVEPVSTHDFLDAVSRLVIHGPTDSMTYVCAQPMISLRHLATRSVASPPRVTKSLNFASKVLIRMPSFVRSASLIDGLIGLTDRGDGHLSEQATFQNLSTQRWDENCFSRR